MQFSTAAVQQAIIKTLKTRANDLACKTIIDTVNKHLRIYYGEYAPTIYPRTYDLLEMAVQLEPIIQGNCVTFRVGFNTGALSTGQWYNKGKTGFHHNGGLGLDSLIEGILLRSEHGGAFTSGKNIIENVKNDPAMVAQIKADIISAFTQAGFTLA